MTDLDELSRFFLPARLLPVARERHGSYAAAKPFEHTVLEGFFPTAVLERIASSIGRPDGAHWIRRDKVVAKKWGCSDEAIMSPLLRIFLHYLNSGPFLLFLETLAGIEGLLPDPHFWGGGLHQIEKGGFLKVHADFNYYERLRLHRRLNLLLYLNHDWNHTYGGHLEFWDETMTSCTKISPGFNTCVIFSTTDRSFHGHPDPLACPPERTRNSIAVYYYTVGRPPGEQTSAHSTVYRPRPGERAFSTVGPLRGAARLLLPPIVFKLAAALTRHRPQ